MLIFDVREWAKTVARYAQNPHHWRSVELPNGVLRFHSETRLDHKTKRMLVHERFDIEDGEESRSTENDFTMQPFETIRRNSGFKPLFQEHGYPLTRFFTDRPPYVCLYG
jgi:hypothetical protein